MDSETISCCLPFGIIIFFLLIFTRNHNRKSGQVRKETQAWKGEPEEERLARWEKDRKWRESVRREREDRLKAMDAKREEVMVKFREQAEAERLTRERREKALQLTHIDSMNGFLFEAYVASLLRSRGFVVEELQKSNDYGVDLIATKDDERIAIQVKRYSSKVSRKAISDAVAGKAFYQCNSAMVVTNNYFTKGAKEMASGTGCVLINRNELAKWIIEFKSPY